MNNTSYLSHPVVRRSAEIFLKRAFEYPDTLGEIRESTLNLLIMTAAGITSKDFIPPVMEGFELIEEDPEADERSSLE